MSNQIIGKIDGMNDRLNELEKSLQTLMEQADAAAAAQGTNNGDN
ncbi:hypothetical protein H696_03460 [Fonticula alba]|uniref:Heat shock factor binding protein 1 n=1 Tax=Fonticula alba TaxID=691883 RepID=A0A058Z6Y0_FONAL|nr:hypothetical protein H696_03460 [Fonticula alba]KCV69995.1 hypothetical protein H696_03460 [Fonticula alba]|eukprot:XP_009495601.1 hypothetical protein H696_03460 [Fonticula alba]